MKPELMAPVGSYESLTAAAQAGADSVYFGMEALNMRSNSSQNFRLDDLEKIVAFCKEKGMKSYLTINIVLYDQDLSLMRSFDAAAQAGVDAIIASDVAVMQYAKLRALKCICPPSSIFQISKRSGFTPNLPDVVVLARELNLDQVKAIHQQIKAENICGPGGQPVRIEMFCHGALCMAVSGKCYLSLHEMNASANRGACMQICRRAYRVQDGKTGSDIELTVDNQYILSPKDLKTIHFLNKMLDAGVEVFKIEGRARETGIRAHGGELLSRSFDRLSRPDF